MSAHAWALALAHPRRGAHEASAALAALLAVLCDLCGVVALSYRLRTASRP